jgi:hypothetical protein
MHFILKHKKYIMPALGVVFIVLVLAVSLKAAFTALAGIAAMLFGDNQRKRDELELKTDKLKQVEQESRAVADELKRVNRVNEKIITDRESEVDSWLDS